MSNYDISMNAFDKKKLINIGCYPLKSEKISLLQVLLTLKCNLRCTHCYLDASPESTGEMSLSTIEKVLDVLVQHEQITTIELTGGEAMLNPHFRYFMKSAAALDKKLTVASNLTLFHEPGMDDIPELLAEYNVKIFASLPYYEEEIMEKQRGKGTYKKVIASLKKLNELGYGNEGGQLELDIEFNPSKIDFAPDQQALEKEYKEKLMEMYGITFNRLVVLNNAPLGRTRQSLSEHEYNKYMKELERRFSSETVKDGNLMCKYAIIISPDGKIYNCGFFRYLDLSLSTGNFNIDDFDYEVMSKREITTNPICFYCMAGSGVSCFKFNCTC